MDINKTSQYALRVLGFMALDERALYIAEQISATLNIPTQYLRRLLTNLSKAGLLNSDKGKGGGFRLAKPAGSIYLSDILAATEKKELLNSCIFGLEKCLRDTPCAMHERWTGAKENILDILKTTSLSEMIKDQSDTGLTEISNL
jgi:Rrf2 family protein